MCKEPVAEFQSVVRIGVGGVLYFDGRLLLGRRSHTVRFYPGQWDIVGGHSESGETVEQTLVREFREELGVQPTVFNCLGVFDEPRASEYGSARYYVYVIREWAGDPQNISDEHTEIRWFRIGELATLDLASRDYIDIFGQLEL